MTLNEAEVLLSTLIGKDIIEDSDNDTLITNYSSFNSIYEEVENGIHHKDHKPLAIFSIDKKESRTITKDHFVHFYKCENHGLRFEVAIVINIVSKKAVLAAYGKEQTPNNR